MTVEQEKGGKIKSKKEKGKRGKGGRISNIEHPISNYEVRLPRCARNDGAHRWRDIRTSKFSTKAAWFDPSSSLRTSQAHHRSLPSINSG